MLYTFTTFQVRFPERNSLWTGYSTREQAEATARGVSGAGGGVVESRSWTAEIPAWRLESLEAEIREGRTTAVRVTA